MRVTLKLFATLSEYLPSGARDNTISIEATPGATPNAVIDRYHVPRELTHLVLINGIYCAADQRDRTELHDGDTVAVWPPVAGG